MKVLRFFYVFLLMGGMLCVPSLAKADVWVVSAGISDYPGTKNDLALSKNDAETMASLYRLNADAHVVLLTDKQATSDNIVREMKKLYAKAGAEDIIVLFFSGHGVKGALCAYDGFLSYEKIRDCMSASSSKNKMIFADACFSGKMRQKGHAKKSSALNVMLFLSSRDNEPSIENVRMKNGFFTSCLQRCLRGGADANGDRIITAKELFEAVSAGVKKLSHDKQHPVMWGNFDDNMPVMVW
ncbi:MAG: caspase family protein [Bacteroidaceae bacterium]|nr:caspase family protein [Bacteroidaceae bacterium]